MYLERAKRRLEEINEMKKRFKEMGIEGSDWGELRLNEPEPCTEDEVKALEEKLGRTLPEAYKEFLLWMGKGVGKGNLMAGEDFFVWNWEKEQEMLKLVRELFEEDEFPGELPEDAFVFLFHQGYSFLFFRLSEGDDPPVYLWIESETSFQKISEHFSDWLLERIELHGKSVKNYGESMMKRLKNST